MSKTAQKTKLSSRYSFVLLIASAIIIAGGLVGISMWLYFQSGAAQLDMSRPSLQAVRNQAQQTDKFEGFKADGPLSEKDLDEFEVLYDRKAKELQNATKTFFPESMSDASLGIRAE